MISLDTNIIARYLLNDSPAQADKAEKLLHGSEACTAPVTVFLELVWVLESCDCERIDIAKSIRLLCGLENFKPQHLDALAYALHWYEGGMDFGDALHLAMSAKESSFKTFDKAFVKRAQSLEAHPDVTLP
jgi:predicted nucleic-acid-binding protein